MTVISSTIIKAAAREAGFSACGIAPAGELTEAKRLFMAALAEGRQADMHFLEKDIDKRFNPELLLPGCRSVIVLTLDYRIADKPASDKYRMARFTWIEDYHTLVKRKAQQMLATLKEHCPDMQSRITVDSSCISEKNWAVMAGVGCIGKNSLVHNGQGSFFVIGTILTNCATDAYDSPKNSDCGTCRRCIDHCPAHALEPYKLDAERCFAYQTIENKNTDFEIFKKSPLLFGCDCCQEVCPHNKKKIQPMPSVSESSLFLRLKNEDLETLTIEDFKTYFGNTPIARRKYDKMSRAILTKQKTT